MQETEMHTCCAMMTAHSGCRRSDRPDLLSYTSLISACGLALSKANLIRCPRCVVPDESWLFVPCVTHLGYYQFFLYHLKISQFIYHFKSTALRYVWCWVAAGTTASWGHDFFGCMLGEIFWRVIQVGLSPSNYGQAMTLNPWIFIYLFILFILNHKRPFRGTLHFQTTGLCAAVGTGCPVRNW